MKKKSSPPETAIIYAVKKQIVTTISTAGTTLLSWNKTNIFHGYKARIWRLKMKYYPKFPFSHIRLFVFPLIASQLDSFSRHVGSFDADQKFEDMCLGDQLFLCKHYCIILMIGNTDPFVKYVTNWVFCFLSLKQSIKQNKQTTSQEDLVMAR